MVTEETKKPGGPNPETDEVLFRRFQRGDEAAFEEILSRYRAPLFSLIMRSAKNRAEAEDLFQEVFFKVIEKRGLFSPTVSFKAWIYTVCRNTCIDTARRHKRRPAGQSLFDEEKPFDRLPQSGEMSPDAATREKELMKQLDEVLGELPEEQRETFELKFHGELTFEEIGATMNCSVNTAKSRMRYAMEQIREICLKRGLLK